MVRHWFRWILACASAFILLVCLPLETNADSLQSNNYRFEETVLGSGGLVQSNSANYQISETIGDTAGGSSSSSNFQFEAGNKTTNDPTLSFSINNGTPSFGDFSPGGAAVATTTYSVANYTSYGYAVQIIGNPPSNGTHTLPAMSSTGPSVAGTEQFGVNLVANTLPVSLGANPDHGQFGFGSAAPNYGTPNSYRYVSGETIATAPKSSGVTTYTISYIANVTSLTPGGQYSTNQTLICTGTY